MLTSDDLSTLRELVEKIGAEKHFNAGSAWRKACTKKVPHLPRYAPDWIERIMRRAILDGYAVESRGARGGKGWMLTTKARELSRKPL